MWGERMESMCRSHLVVHPPALALVTLLLLPGRRCAHPPLARRRVMLKVRTLRRSRSAYASSLTRVHVAAAPVAQVELRGEGKGTWARTL